jgi:CRP/FNR family cyclic AMP-dependent transcriptional regulator
MKFLHAFHGWEDTVEFDSGATVFSEGDTADVLFVILSGEVELKLRGESLGNEKAGGIIGEMALIPSAACSTTAVALSQVRLARLDREQLGEVINQNSEFSLHVMAVLANRLRAVDRYITERT